MYTKSLSDIDNSAHNKHDLIRVIPYLIFYGTTNKKWITTVWIETFYNYYKVVFDNILLIFCILTEDASEKTLKEDNISLENIQANFLLVGIYKKNCSSGCANMRKLHITYYFLRKIYFKTFNCLT